MRRTFALSVLVLLVVPWTARATHAEEQQCFATTNYCITGRFQQFWEQNGGLPIFGYPITAARSEINPDDGQTYLTQWFERARFELHTENAPPYDVLLGRLGVVPAAAQDPPAYRQGESGPQQGCIWFPQTGFNVCDDRKASFATYWQTHGIQDPTLTPYERSLALFGLPLSRRIPAGPGDLNSVQYFERARFEWHAGNLDPYKVELGLLGREAQPPANVETPVPLQPYNTTATSVDLLASFYNAINLQDYQRAYSYWQNPPNSYDDFARGYANTASVQLIVQPPTFTDVGAGNLHQQIATVLIALQRDGSQQRFAGCYTTHKSNLHPPDIPQEDTWHLSGATIAPVAADAAIPVLLASACPNLQPPAYNNVDSPIDILASFYDAINRQDYQRAYDYWQNPPSSYADFVSGYANTSSVQLIVEPPASIGAAAGSSYASIKTVLVAQQQDGSIQLFAGCYVARKSNLQPPDIPAPDVWHLYSATIAPATDIAAIPALLNAGCTGTP